ncbi:MAG: ribosome small subunit-dependent GTPase A, partial [bacterium]
RHGQNVVVEDDNEQLVHCLLRQNLGNVVCGDRIVWQSTGDREGVITAVLDRDTVLSRPDYSGRAKPLAANLSQLVVVLAPKPEPTGYLLDQYLVAAELIGVSACITLNKSDLLSSKEWDSFRERYRCYEDIGYPLLGVSAKREHGLDPLTNHMENQTSILVGQSGVGKSSLINALISNRQAQIGRLSEATGLGKHTTSSTTLYHLPTGGHLIDSPGVRSFRLGEINQSALELGFREFHDYLGKCRFSNCTHNTEPDCALAEAVASGSVCAERLENFHRLLTHS